MTSNQGGGTHPGDPWSPDWQPSTPESTSEEEWPYDESLTLSDAEIEIAGLDDEEDEPGAEPEVDAAEVADEDLEEVAEPEADAEQPDTEAETVEPEEADESVEAAALEAEEAAAAVAALEAEEAAAAVAALEAEEAAAKEAEEAAAAVAAREAEEAAAKEAAETAAREAEEAAAAVAALEAEEAAAKEAEEAAAAVAAREAEEAAAKEAEEAAAAVAAREAEEAAAKEAEEAAAAVAAREAEEAAAKEAEEAAAAVAALEAEEAAAKEAEEAAAAVAALEAEEAAAKEAEEAAAVAALEAAEAEAPDEPPGGGDDVALRAVADASVEEGLEQTDDSPIEEVAVEDLQAEPEWLEAVEEMTLDDIAEAGETRSGEEAVVVAAVPAAPDEDSSDEPEMATAVIESIASGDGDDVPEDMVEVVMEDATFEVVDLDDAELRADTAEHMLEALDLEDEEDDTAIAHDEITAEVPVAAVPVVEVVDPPPVADIEFEVPPEYQLVATNVDETRDALAAFMAEPAATEVVDVEAGAVFDYEEALVEEVPEAEDAVEEAPLVEGQLQIPTAVAEPISMTDGTDVEQGEAEPEPEPGPLTPEQELIARLSGDLTLPDFETFVQEDFARDFVSEPTQEHLGLAEAVSSAEAPEQSALAVTMPGVDHGHVGFQDLDEALHFDDPDAPDEEPSEEIVAETESYGSDLTLRVASGVILVALLAGALWAGGVTFLIFITVIALAAQIEFYAALRSGGYRPLVLFGLFGGLGALVGTYAQGSDFLREGPIAIAAALGLTIVATFAWYGAQETPPRHPWRNGLVTILGVAWIPALLALVFPMAELPRSDRFPIIIVLLLAVAAFDVGSYFVGRALGSRKLSPALSPNKTVEGLIGGVIATVIVALLSAAVVDVFDVGTALAVAAGVIIASPLGDLAESLVKRSLGIKDMSQLVPGHGGVLDRIDSYLFAVPVAYLVLRWTGLL